MTILLTGASGFVGRALLHMLAAEGRMVRAAARKPIDLPTGGIQAIMPDLALGADWAPLVEGVNCVIHCAARAHILKEEAGDPLRVFRETNAVATAALARAGAAAGARRFVFLSSIGVNGGETQGVPFRHDDAPAPQSPYAIAKLEAELELATIARETGLELVIIRPPLVLGRDAPGNIGMLARAIRKGLPLPLGAVTSNKRDLVSVSTLGRLVSTCIDHPNAAGQTFLVSDGQAMSTRQLVERIAAIEGKQARLVPVPPALLGFALRLTGKGGMASQLLGDLEVDIAHTASVLGWHPPAQP